LLAVIPISAHAQDAGTVERVPELAVDPRIDRGNLTPTPRTHAPGTLTVGLEGIVLAAASYVLPTHTELSARYAPLLNGHTAAIGTVKQPLLREGRLRLTALATGSRATAWGQGGDFLGVGLLAGFCIDRSCESLAWLSANGGVEGYKGDDASPRRTGLLFHGGPGLMLALSPTLKLVGEVRMDRSELDRSLVPFLGRGGSAAVRFFNRHVAADVGVTYVSGWASEWLPVLSVTWRP
jgi:hypothetical protein